MTVLEITDFITDVIADNKAIFLGVFPLVFGITLALKVIRRKSAQVGNQISK